MKSYKINEILLCVIFCLMIILPLFFRLAGNGEDTASLEKRAMAQMPDPSLMLKDFSAYTARFEKYYNDSFGLRDKLIGWNNLLRIALFRESPVKGVRWGRDGWLFYANEWVLEDYENIMPYKEEDLNRIRKVLEERRLWLERRGMKFYVLVAPNKHTIYPEYLPASLHKIGKESRLDQVVRSLKDVPRIPFVDVRSALLKEKPVQRLYHRTDTHWNDYGAFIGYRELMERIGKDFPNVRKLSLDDFNVRTIEGKGGDLAGMLSLSDRIKEERITLIPKSPPRAVDALRDYPDPVDLHEYPDRKMVIKETRDPALPKALVFRDSFSWPLIPYLAESFRSVVFFWKFDFLPEIIERERPDVVILECVERYLNALTIENPEEVRAVPQDEKDPFGAW